MKFPDLLYFSKGERRALTVLLCLIVSAFTLLVLTDKAEITHDAARITAADTVRGIATPVERPVTVRNKPASPETKGLFAVKGFHRPEERRKATAGAYPEKFAQGTVVELNGADTIILRKVPGIGAAFSGRIIKYRNLLGGFCSEKQLSEVYGIDESRYLSLKDWFIADSSLIRPVYVNLLPVDSIARHPYISYRQAREIVRLRKLYGALSGWETLSLLEEFPEEDIARLRPYVSFESTAGK